MHTPSSWKTHEKHMMQEDEDSDLISGKLVIFLTSWGFAGFYCRARDTFPRQAFIELKMKKNLYMYHLSV